jgi:predicted nucleic acid-binding protein
LQLFTIERLIWNLNELSKRSIVIPANGLQFLKDIINVDFTVSFVSYIEFLGYKNVTKASEDFIALANVIEVDKAIIDACIAIRKQHSIKLPDAIIAATALAYNLTILTRNTNDFKNITGLQVVNPWEL